MKNAIQKGFTLIELLVVVVVLGILAAFAYGSFQSYSGVAQKNVNSYLVATVTSSIATCKVLGGGTCTTALNLLIPDSGGGVTVNPSTTAPEGTVINGACTITVQPGGLVSPNSGCQ